MHGTLAEMTETYCTYPDLFSSPPVLTLSKMTPSKTLSMFEIKNVSQFLKKLLNWYKCKTHRGFKSEFLLALKTFFRDALRTVQQKFSFNLEASN